jgi:hypothetical protein
MVVSSIGSIWCMYVCMYVCVCACMYIHIYIHTHTHSHTFIHRLYTYIHHTHTHTRTYMHRFTSTHTKRKSLGRYAGVAKWVNGSSSGSDSHTHTHTYMHRFTHTHKTYIFGKICGCRQVSERVVIRLRFTHTHTYIYVHKHTHTKLTSLGRYVDVAKWVNGSSSGSDLFTYETTVIVMTTTTARSRTHMTPRLCMCVYMYVCV